MANYAVVRTDNLAGTDARSMLVSVKYMGFGGKTPTEIENGHVLAVGPLAEGEREVRIGTDPTSSTPINEVVLIATPEMTYCTCNGHGLHNFINKAGSICRGYRLHSGDHFSVTKGALTGKAQPFVGDIVELSAGTMLNVANTATVGSTQIGRIKAIEKAGMYEFYVIEVN